MRHSVFVLGPAGTGKSQVIKTLNKTYQNQKRKPLLHDINPKAVTADELFGFINPATREWKDGKLYFESSLGLQGLPCKVYLLNSDLSAG